MVRLRAFGATALQARGLLIVAAAILAVSITMRAQETRSVKTGVYTAAQAARGVGVYRSKCASCHAPNRFTDDFFYISFAGKPLWEMFDVISDSMPEDDPGSLSKEQYADVIAYLLQLNKFPPGETDLPTDKDALSAILFEKP
jgi:mono/diheme cytochrome c family protein